MDKVYKKDENYYNIEFQSNTITHADIIRFFKYHVDLAYTYKTNNIYSIILCTGKIKMNRSFKTHNSFFNPIILSLKDYDGDKILNNIKEKIKNNQKLGNKDISYIMFLPLFSSKKTEQEMLKETIILTNQIGNITQNELDNIKLVQVLFVDRFVKNNELSLSYLEEIKMKSRSLDLIKEQGIEQGIEQGREEGIEQGREEGREEGYSNAEVDIARKLLSLDVPIDKIAKSTNLSIDEIKKMEL